MADTRYDEAVTSHGALQSAPLNLVDSQKCEKGRTVSSATGEQRRVAGLFRKGETGWKRTLVNDRAVNRSPMSEMSW